MVLYLTCQLANLLLACFGQYHTIREIAECYLRHLLMVLVLEGTHHGQGKHGMLTVSICKSMNLRKEDNSCNEE